MAPKSLLEDTFTITSVKPIQTDGKNWDKVRQIRATSQRQDKELSLDIYSEKYPMRTEETFLLHLASTLSLDETPETGFYDGSGKPSLADDFEYVMHGKILSTTDVEQDGMMKGEVLVSFGGFLLKLKVDPNDLSPFKADQNLYLLIKKVPAD